MRFLISLIVLIVCGIAAPARAKDPARPEVALVVVTLDQVRQIQIRHGQATLGRLGDARWGRFAFAGSTLTPDLFAPCLDDRPDDALDYCIRYYLTRVELAAAAPPTVVVVFDDRSGGVQHRGAGEMRALCFGRGVVPTDAAAQDTWLWPDSARVHGVNDWHRDRDALGACVEAAAAEAWTAVRQPDVD